MIKPGTLCMIRGIPSNRPGYECNGKIVVATTIKATLPDLGVVWWIDPPLPAPRGGAYSGCAERWLHPLDPCEDDLAREAVDQALHDVFVNAVLEKL